MKRKFKRLFIVLMATLIVISGGLLYLFQQRQYFCISEDKCVTLWKTAEGAYIIPGKYTSWFKPKDNYIKTESNSGNIDIIWIDQIPKSIIIKQESRIKYHVVSNRTSNFYIYKYENDIKKFDSLIYDNEATKYNDIRIGVYRMSIDILESYARTNDGRILR